MPSIISHRPILNTGIKADFKFDKTNELNSMSGSSKINILNNYLRFIFALKNNQIEITKANLKNKVPSFHNCSKCRKFPLLKQSYHAVLSR